MCQCVILSAPHYKGYNNSFLVDVEDRFCGVQIETVSIPHVTVADDMCFITEDESNRKAMPGNKYCKLTKYNENKLLTDRAAISQKVATQQLKLN